MSDLKEVIARVRKEIQNARVEPDGTLDMWFVDDDITRLLDAAEAGMRARDAALEEAARVADKEALLQQDRVKNSRLTFAPDACAEIATSIRALRGAAQWTCPMRGKILERCGVREHAMSNGGVVRSCTVDGCAHQIVAQGGAA